MTLSFDLDRIDARDRLPVAGDILLSTRCAYRVLAVDRVASPVWHDTWRCEVDKLGDVDRKTSTLIRSSWRDQSIEQFGRCRLIETIAYFPGEGPAEVARRHALPTKPADVDQLALVDVPATDVGDGHQVRRQARYLQIDEDHVAAVIGRSAIAKIRAPHDDTLDRLHAVIDDLRTVGVTHMPVLSLWEPWASAVGRMKWVETRSWAPTITDGSWFAVASTKARKPFRDVVATAHAGDDQCTWMLSDLERAGVDLHAVPFGSVVSIARLRTAVTTDDIVIRPTVGVGWSMPDAPERVRITPLEHRWGDYGLGRWAWLLDDVIHLPKPIPFTGGQKLNKRIPLDELAPHLALGGAR